MNKLEKAILKAISRPSYDVKKRYRLERSLKQLKAPLLAPLYKSWDQKVFDGTREINTRVFSPKNKNPRNTIIFFHGGGWVTENIDSYNNICKNLSTYTNSKLISVEYRLAPEHPFPQGFDDCYAVAKQVHQIQVERENLPGKIILMGDSAGGNLAAAVSLKARDTKEFNVAVQVLLYPATYFDHSASSPFKSIQENGTGYILTAQKVCDYMSLYKRSDKDLRNPYFAPLMAEDFSEQPDTLVITAEFDPLRDEGETYGEKLKEAGNVVEIYRMEDAIHGYMYLGPRYVHVKKTYDLINHFLNESEAICTKDKL